jgi:hypothetical protein
MTYAHQFDFFEALGVPTVNTVQFTDRPCGWGKTSKLLKSFKLNDKYFVVVPTRAEIDRVISDAVVPFDTPDEGSYQDEAGVKRSSLLMGLSELIEDGENIVCTHALFDKVNINEFALDDYNVIIDEVFDCVKGFNGPKDETFQTTYIEGELATVEDNGKVIPSIKWLLEGDDAYFHKLLDEAKRGRLHRSGEGFYVTVVPVELFTSNRSCTVMSYLAEGSLMAMYLKKLKVPYEINKNNSIDRSAREQAKERLNISYLDLGLTKAQGYKRQGNWGGKLKEKIANKLKNRCKQMVGVAREDIMVTCRKDLWFDKNDEISSFAKDARLAKANWVHKSTKGTNAYRNCTHAVHMFDLNLNPSVKKFLDVSKEDEDLWKQSEMIQWLYRTDLRNQDSDKEVHLHVTSKPMQELVENWLSDDPIQ